MTNGIEVNDYVKIAAGFPPTDGTVFKVIGMEDHENHYADVHLIFLEGLDIAHLKLRADQVAKLDPYKIDAPIKEALDAFPVHISEDEDFEEDFPGQLREVHIQRAVQRAVGMADAIIIEASDGSLIETDYLTFRVAEAFLAKLGNRAAMQFQAKLMGIKVP